MQPSFYLKQWENVVEFVKKHKDFLRNQSTIEDEDIKVFTIYPSMRSFFSNIRPKANTKTNLQAHNKVQSIRTAELIK